MKELYGEDSKHFSMTLLSPWTLDSIDAEQSF